MGKETLVEKRINEQTEKHKSSDNDCKDCKNCYVNDLLNDFEKKVGSVKDIKNENKKYIKDALRELLSGFTDGELYDKDVQDRVGDILVRAIAKKEDYYGSCPQTAGRIVDDFSAITKVITEECYEYSKISGLTEKLNEAEKPHLSTVIFYLDFKNFEEEEISVLMKVLMAEIKKFAYDKELLEHFLTNLENLREMYKKNERKMRILNFTYKHIAELKGAAERKEIAFAKN